MICISKGQEYRVLVDVTSISKIQEYTWNIDVNGYVYSSLFKNGKHKKLYLHRMLLQVSGSLVDHIDHNRLNNCLSNLRVCSSAENNRNRLSIQGSSKYKGVSFCKKEKRWYAYITLHNKKKHIGIFDCEKEAAEAYNAKALEFFGDFACLNII